jgi:DUF4097 and DUF4098 domain-containing protein YvlB
VAQPLKRICVAAAWLVASMATVTVRAEESEVSFAYVPAPAAESVTVEQPLGNLALRGWDKPEVRIVATKRAATAAGLDRLRVNVELRDGRIRVRTGVRIGDSFRPLPAAEGGGRIDLAIEAPRQATLHATTFSGDIDAAGFRAGAELASSGGEVRANDIEGQLRTHALKGRQRLTAIRGDVAADGVTGDLELDSVDGDVLDARVVEGQVVARQVRTPVVRLFSTAGGILFVGSVRPGGRYELRAEQGDVRLVVTRAPLSLTARAPAGRVTSAFRLGHMTPTLVTGELLGGGPAVELTAANGNVFIDQP